jgi:hypothetical protein
MSRRDDKKKRDKSKRDAAKAATIAENNRRWDEGQSKRAAAARKSLEKHRHLAQNCGNVGCNNCNPIPENIGWRRR